MYFETSLQALWEDGRLASPLRDLTFNNKEVHTTFDLVLKLKYNIRFSSLWYGFYFKLRRVAPNKELQTKLIVWHWEW